MDEIDVLAVMGTCAPERSRYAARLAAAAGRVLFPAQRLRVARDPVQEAIDLVPWTDRPSGAVCEFPGRTHPVDLIAALSDEHERARLTGIVCVVDAMHLLDDLHRDHYVARVEVGAEGLTTECTAHALLTVTQIEFASMIVLVNWEPLATRELSTVMALVSHLGPRARLRLDHGAIEVPARGARYSGAQDRQGWVALLNGEHDPHMTDRRVSAVRYEQARPFHPSRLREVLDERVEAGEFGTVIRSAGLCRLATRPGVIGEWQHVGRMLSLEPLTTAMPDASGGGAEDHELLALGQDLAVIGLDLDAGGLTRALDRAALTDAEFAAGPSAWARYPDPFPAWQGITERTE